MFVNDEAVFADNITETISNNFVHGISYIAHSYDLKINSKKTKFG